MKNISILICVAVVAILAVGCTGKGEKDLSANLVPSVSESPKNAAKVITLPSTPSKTVQQISSEPKEKEIPRLQEGQKAEQALKVKVRYFAGLSGEQLVEINVENFGRWQNEDILLAKVRYWYEGQSQTVTNDSISVSSSIPSYWQPLRTRNGNKLLHFNLEIYSAFDENLEDLPLLDDAGNKTEMITLGTFDVSMP